MRPRLASVAIVAAAIAASFGSTQAVAGGGISYSGQGNVNVTGNGGYYQVPIVYSQTPTLCNPCGGAIYQPQNWHQPNWHHSNWGGPVYGTPISVGSAMAASLVGGIANTQQTGGSVTGGNVNIGGAGAAAASATGGSWGWGRHHGGGGSSITPTATSTVTAEVNYSNTNQTTNTTTNNITDSFNTNVTNTINKTYNIDNSVNTNFNFYILGNSNAVNTGSGAAIISDSGNNVGNTNGRGRGGHGQHGGVWNLAGLAALLPSAD